MRRELWTFSCAGPGCLTYAAVGEVKRFIQQESITLPEPSTPNSFLRNSRRSAKLATRPQGFSHSRACTGSNSLNVRVASDELQSGGGLCNFRRRNLAVRWDRGRAVTPQNSRWVLRASHVALPPHIEFPTPLRVDSQLGSTASPDKDGLHHIRITSEAVT
jgi:hypothetical protein